MEVESGGHHWSWPQTWTLKGGSGQAGAEPRGGSVGWQDVAPSAGPFIYVTPVPRTPARSRGRFSGRHRSAETRPARAELALSSGKTGEERESGCVRRTIPWRWGREGNKTEREDGGGWILPPAEAAATHGGAPETAFTLGLERGETRAVTRERCPRTRAVSRDPRRGIPRGRRAGSRACRQEYRVTWRRPSQAGDCGARRGRPPEGFKEEEVGRRLLL